MANSIKLPQEIKSRTYDPATPKETKRQKGNINPKETKSLS